MRTGALRLCALLSTRPDIAARRRPTLGHTEDWRPRPEIALAQPVPTCGPSLRLRGRRSPAPHPAVGPARPELSASDLVQQRPDARLKRAVHALGRDPEPLGEGLAGRERHPHRREPRLQPLAVGIGHLVQARHGLPLAVDEMRALTGWTFVVAEADTAYLCNLLGGTVTRKVTSAGIAVSLMVKLPSNP